MDAIDALVRSLPGEAARVRQRFWRDPEFRAVGEDYRASVNVLAALEAAPVVDAARVDEYRRLAAELLAEALAMLEGNGP